MQVCLFLPVTALPWREGGTAAWLVGTLVVSSVQGHGLPPPQELWLYQSLFEPLVAGNQKASLASLSP